MIATAEAIVARAVEGYRTDGRFLAVLRIAYGLWVVFLPVDILWISAVPQDFLNPRPGLFSFIATVPSLGVLIAITVIRFVLAVLLAIGACTVPVSLLLTITMMTAAGISYSFSKVDHFILFELVPVFLAFAGWGRRWSVDELLARRRGRFDASTRGMPVLLFAIALGWAMLSAAVPKALGGWLDPSRQATRGYIASDIVTGDNLGPLGAWILPFDLDIFWKALDYATLAAEGLLILFVFTPVLFRCWLLLLLCFHIGVYLTLGISFLSYALVYAVFFAPIIMWIAHRISVVARQAADGNASRT